MAASGELRSASAPGRLVRRVRLSHWARWLVVQAICVAGSKLCGPGNGGRSNLRAYGRPALERLYAAAVRIVRA